METLEQINTFKALIEKKYHADLLEKSRKGENYLVIDFADVSEFNINLGELLLENPDEVIKAAEMAIEQFDLPGDSDKFEINIKNIPESSKRLISDKRSSDFEKLLAFDGVIRAKSTVLARKVCIRYECPSCGNIISVLQLDKKIRQPTSCGCGRKGKFRELSNEKIDVQKLELEELSENVKGTSQPQRLKVTLKGKLIDPRFEPKFNPGAKVQIVGILKELPIQDSRGANSVDSDFILDAVHIENIEDEEIDLNISEKEMKVINKIAKSEKHVEKLREALIPSVYGHDDIKESILIQLIGGTRKKVDDGTVKRGDIHILIIGDPGTAKSATLQRVEKVLPHARVANGKGATGVGLTAAVIRDDFVGWTFAAGTLVLANKNVAIIDEFDKMTKEDRDQIHEALEQQTVTLSKANVQARLSCECSLLAGANPKFGRFNAYNSIIDEINLPPTIINRFDLIIPVKDEPNPDIDEKTGRKILSIHSNKSPEKSEIDTQLLRKYIFLAKKIKPVISEGASEKLLNHYLTIRGRYNKEEGKIAVPISARQLEGLIRLSEAYAKLRLSKEVSTEDAVRGINLMDKCLKKIATDPETGEQDIDKFTTGITTHQRGNIVKIKELISKLENDIGKNIPIEDLIEAASTEKISEEEVERAIEKLKRSGDIFEPRRGFVSRI
jgi:replicative DNA helicase Mcm